MLRELVRLMAPRNEVLFVNAFEEGRAIASQLFLRHGRSATYQMGWTTPRGRKLGAHHRMLWEAMLTLKGDGVGELDLGGVESGEDGGLARFKQGTGGETVTLIGHWR